MLRILVLILFLANLLFYLWVQGLLTSVVGVQPGGQHEPERMARQVHPEMIRVLPPESASATASDVAAPDVVASAGAVASAPGASAPGGAVDTVACLEVGAYTLAERVQVEGKLKTVIKPDDWMDNAQERAGAWMVYMGRYASEDLLRKKEDELHRFKLDYTIVRTPANLRWGLSLGQYEQRAEADAALDNITQRGVRSARVVITRQPDIGHTLRIPSATPAIRIALANLPAATWLGRSIKPCGAPTSAPAP